MGLGQTPVTDRVVGLKTPKRFKERRLKRGIVVNFGLVWQYVGFDCNRMPLTIGLNLVSCWCPQAVVGSVREI